MTAPALGRRRRGFVSAWWLLWSLLPGIGWLVLFVTIALLSGQPRPSRYGSPPR